MCKEIIKKSINYRIQVKELNRKWIKAGHNNKRYKKNILLKLCMDGQAERSKDKKVYREICDRDVSTMGTKMFYFFRFEFK